jgi:hypothetical protein
MRNRVFGQHIQALRAGQSAVITTEKGESLKTRAEPGSVEAIKVVGGKEKRVAFRKAMTVAIDIAALSNRIF